MKTINIRQAKESDIEFLAVSMLKSTRFGKKIGIFDILFDERKDNILLKKIEKLISISNKIYCHYSHFLIAQSGETPIGTLCNYEPRISTNNLFEEVLKDLQVDKEHDKYASIALLCDFEIDKKIWMLDFLTQDNNNSLESTRLLLKKSLLTASLKGYRIIRTTINLDNIDTILIYQKLGFKVISEKKCNLFKDEIGHNRVAMLEFHI